ncbi:hypothetical protein M501DRAFT_243447 [Patellaria atrata CBS 101060]|uniref:MADS-box domain-containing protein n=1 Tax=Patellaria atrata CBS 101060 TaxID=1346257 RepID=A0A9P4S5X0_9PEZI|nr:hypothetical protein M501DRAFT_243447 [Patellaria atrata CBS 101060]
MGRRKIEIKAIKDDRNRSVTFLKRKGGLFKKAHELSVLCSVDVAVIIFGHNKKLYEFSSGDINETIGRYQYYGGAHEHKGPEDFMGKRDGDDDDEDDEVMEDQVHHSHSPPEHGMLHHPLQNQAYQHIRHHTPSASPPMPNSIAFHHRHPSPQPHGISRPASRTHIRRSSSNLAVPPHHPTSQPAQQNSFAYMPNPPIYNGPPVGGPPNMSVKPPGPPPPPPQQQQPHSQHQPQLGFTYPPPAHSQVQQAYLQEQRRQSMPPAFPQHERPQQPTINVPSPPQPEHNQFQSPPLPQPKPLPLAAKSHSIFTPIDGSLAQHWGNIGNETSKTSPPMKLEAGPRSQSIDVASIARPQTNGSSPHEHSDAGSTAGSSPKDASVSTAPKGSTETSHTSSVVLPPPSPSASALLSAGATGPPNPFARPAPPVNSNSYGSRSDMETPISALPSRFVADGLLPSPSSFYPEWGFGRESNVLPSPLTFQTPVVTSGPSFRDEDSDRKRKTSEGSEGGLPKRIRS